MIVNLGFVAVGACRFAASRAARIADTAFAASANAIARTRPVPAPPRPS